MKNSDLALFWRKSAAADLKTARNLLRSRDYVWCMFMMHLVIEKSLKASWILDNNKAFPPKTHNLLRLAAEIKTNLKEEQKLLLFDMNDFNLEARYPDFKLTFKKRCNRAFAQGYFAQAEELYRWLSTQK